MCLLSVCSNNTNPKVGGSKPVGGGHVGGGGGVGVEGVDVGQQGAHDGRDAGTHVLRGQTGKVPERKMDRAGLYPSSPQQSRFHPVVPVHSFNIQPEVTEANPTLASLPLICFTRPTASDKGFRGALASE